MQLDQRSAFSVAPRAARSHFVCLHLFASRDDALFEISAVPKAAL